MKYKITTSSHILFLVAFLVSTQNAVAQLSDSTPPPVLTCVNLKKDLRYKMSDSQGSVDIKNLQTFLVESKFTQGDVVSFFGDETLRAVKLFQDKAGIASTGFVGKQTRDRIKEISCTSNVSLRQNGQQNQGQQKRLALFFQINASKMSKEEKERAVSELRVLIKNTTLSDEQRNAAQEELRKLLNAKYAVATTSKVPLPPISSSACSLGGVKCGLKAPPTQLGLSESERATTITQLQNMLISQQLTNDQKVFIESRLRKLLSTSTPVIDPDFSTSSRVR
jgi:peptidoglycan hydrolase-like protein with peptidoglycan-binding domain